MVSVGGDVDAVVQTYQVGADGEAGRSQTIEGERLRAGSMLLQQISG